MSLVVGVPVATLWTSPDAPRPVDSAAVADEPDVLGWTAALGPAHRLGLHGRTLTQALLGEPVVVLEERGAWLRVALPWQPGPCGAGYPGWLRRSHVGQPSTAVEEPTEERGRRLETTAPPPPDVVTLARQHLGLTYLWGGTSPAGLDCSGLVHLVHRRLGVVVPRDSPDQRAAAEPVPLTAARPGDLFFSEDGSGRTTHVGLVVAPGDPPLVLHAPEGDEHRHGRVVEELLTRPLAALGRFSA